MPSVNRVLSRHLVPARAVADLKPPVELQVVCRQGRSQASGWFGPNLKRRGLGPYSDEVEARVHIETHIEKQERCAEQYAPHVFVGPGLAKEEVAGSKKDPEAEMSLKG